MADPFAAYRLQNGIAPTSNGPDPVVVDWIQQAAATTGADPVALLATSLEEAGAHRGEVGDAGTSFGPFQFHRGGALGLHSPAWANSYAAVLDRARQFARYGVHGGVGAAAVQRPADRQLYASGVNSLLARANQILGRSPGAPATSPLQPTQTVEAPSPYAALDFVNGLLGDVSITRLAQLGQRLTKSEAVKRTPRSAVAGPPPSAPGGSPVSVRRPTLIGLPYQGTHTLYGNWESDNAIDIKLPVGTPVYATEDGVIGKQFGHINTGDAHMAGIRLHLNGAGGNFYYQHLANAVVKPGQRVKAGQLLGYTGALNHLHFAVQRGDPRAYVH